MADSIDDTKSLQEAFELQAEKYKTAADICLKLANIMKNNEQNIEIDAGTHHIGITGPEDIFKELVEENIMYVSFNEDEEDDDDIDEEE